MTRKLTSVKQVPSGRLDKVPVSLVLDDEFLHLSLVTCFWWPKYWSLLHISRSCGISLLCRWSITWRVPNIFYAMCSAENARESSVCCSATQYGIPSKFCCPFSLSQISKCHHVSDWLTTHMAGMSWLDAHSLRRPWFSANTWPEHRSLTSIHPHHKQHLPVVVYILLPYAMEPFRVLRQ